jgi:ABC-2 type transport system permease protein
MSEPAGVIHDIGYQRYGGPRLGRGYAFRSLFVHSLRTAYGLGRSAKAKIFPWLVVTIVGAAAAVIVAVQAMVGVRVVGYAQFVDQVNILVILFCAVVAPELVSRDLRNGVLPLYFSRPLRRSDYALAKLGALVVASWLLLAGPLSVMFLGTAFTLDGPGAVWDEAGELLPGLAHAANTAVVFSAIALLLASFIGRRAVAAGVVVAAFLVTTPVVGLLETAGDQSTQQLAYLASPLLMVMGVQRWLFGTPEFLDIGEFGPLYGATTLALVLGCVGLLLLRYRRVQA